MDSRTRVVADIQKRISNGELTPGCMLPSERVVALQLKVSRSAVQAAYRELAATGFVARKKNFRPHVTGLRRASNLGRTRSDQIAVWIMPDLQDLGGLMILHGIQTVCGSANYKLLVGGAPSGESRAIEEAESEFLQSIIENPQVAGAIIWPTGDSRCKHVYAALAESVVPIVFIDREPFGCLPGDLVATNNFRASRNAVRHLIELGHQRIGMVIGCERASSVLDRIDGYRAAIAEVGIDWSETWVTEFRSEKGREEIEEVDRFLISLMNDPVAPTALFAANDRTALRLVDGAKRLQIAIPERISIVGFDWLMRMLPSGGDLTTVAQPFDEIGRTAARRLLDRIAAQAAETPRHILFDAPLVIRGTTGAPFAFEPLVGSTGDHHAKMHSCVHTY